MSIVQWSQLPQCLLQPQTPHAIVQTIVIVPFPGGVNPIGDGEDGTFENLHVWIIFMRFSLGSPRRDVLKAFGEGASLLIAGGTEDDDADSPSQDPSKILVSKRSKLRIPRIGYSLYKTAADQVEDGVKLALDAGIRHFDVATLYGTTEIVGRALGKAALPEPISVTHKVSNLEQSRSYRTVERAVRNQLRLVPSARERIVLVHSPLGEHRIETYAALAELKSKGEIDAIGAAHFGVGALQELVDRDFPAPDMIQLELSPFHTHQEILQWSIAHDATLCCAAWSKLSSAEGPREGWEILGKIATAHSCTKQQILIRWAVQNGFMCVPRSSSKFKVERQAIRENSWLETKDIVLTDTEMKLLDSLDERIPVGRLRVLDGWAETDIVDDQWDPTNII